MAMPKNQVVRGRGGRIAGTNGLTDQQRLFVRDYVANGGNGSAAARSAKYATPHSAAYDLTNNPKIASAIYAEQSRLLRGDLANLSLGVLRKILEGTDDAPAAQRLRLDAAKTVLDRAGHVAPKAEEAPRDPTAKPMNEWSIAELDAFIAESKAKLDGMRVVSPDAGQDDGADTQADTQERQIIDVEEAESLASTLPSVGGEDEEMPQPPAPRWLAAPAAAPSAEGEPTTPTGGGGT